MAGSGSPLRITGSYGGAGGVKTTIVWDVSEISHNLEIMPAFIDRAISAALAKNASPATAFARSNAPWNDQTGNARSGLTTKAGKEGDLLTLTVSHGVDYGIWLETRWGGKYAIIDKTLEYIGPRVMKTFSGILDRFPGGA